MSDWNPTDDELRAIVAEACLCAASRCRHERDLARLVLREREALAAARAEAADRRLVTTSLGDQMRMWHAKHDQALGVIRETVDHYAPQLDQATRELVEARAALARVRELHQLMPNPLPPHKTSCVACRDADGAYSNWPCQTILAVAMEVRP